MINEDIHIDQRFVCKKRVVFKRSVYFRPGDIAKVNTSTNMHIGVHCIIDSQKNFIFMAYDFLGSINTEKYIFDDYFESLYDVRKKKIEKYLKVLV